MVTLQFIWDQFSYYEDESDNLSGKLVEHYEGNTIEEACNDAAACFDWNDEEVYNFNAKSELHETSRDLQTISIDVEGKWEEVKPEIYEYYGEAEEKAMEA